MPAFTDPSARIDEPKTARMEQRTKPHVKAEIQRAAVLLGVDETTFVTSVAYERARAIVIDYERTALTPQDRDVFLAALDTPAAPTDALREASALHRRMVLDGD